MESRWHLFGIAFLVLLSSIEAMQACQICVPFPKKSAADYLIDADVVVLAREDPERPFHFQTMEILKGAAGEKPIDLFLDSSTRRILTAYSDRSVVITKTSEKGRAIWKRIGMADSDTGPLVRKILKLEPIWKENPRQRIDFFSQFLGHENPQISTLAHLEIARAPYSEIRRLRNILPRDEIRQFLGNVRYIEWHALYILLLAQSEDKRDQQFIRESFDSAAKFEITIRLAAWATAYIELDGNEALRKIEELYFGNSGRSETEIRIILQAISLHGTNGDTDLRDRIVESYGSLITHYPSVIPEVTRDLAAWKRTEYAGQIGVYVRGNPGKIDFQTTLRLRSYSRTALSSPK